MGQNWGSQGIPYLEEPEDLRGAGVGLKLAAREGHGAVRVEGQHWLVVESAGVLQRLLIEGRLVALHHHLEWEAPHFVTLPEPKVLRSNSP